MIDSIRLNQEKFEYGFNKPLRFDFSLRNDLEVENLTIGIQLFNSSGAKLMTPNARISRLERGGNLVSLILENPYLPPGQYSINVGMAMLAAGIFYQTEVLSFEIPEVGINDEFLTSRKDSLGIYPPTKVEIFNLNQTK